MAITNSLNIIGTGLVKGDGLGGFSAVTTTIHGTLVGAASNGITSIVQGAGQLLIGTTASDPSAASLTNGTGISITSSSGAITINATGKGLTWSTVTGTTQTIAVNSGYVANNAGQVVFTLPTTASLGDAIVITGINNATGWKINQNALQQIFSDGSSTTVGVGGSITSINTRDTISMYCVVAGSSTVYNVDGGTGSWTIV